MAGTSCSQWNDDDSVHFVLDQHAQLDHWSRSSLKQQYARSDSESTSVVIVPTP